MENEFEYAVNQSFDGRKNKDMTKCCGYSCGPFQWLFTYDSAHGKLATWLQCATFTLILIALIMPVSLYGLGGMGLNEAVVIDSKDAPSYETWLTNAPGTEGDSNKIHYDIHLFDIQNPLGMLNGEKPSVVEKGPYAFEEYFLKLDIVWTDDGNEVNYYNQKYYIFNEERTGPGLHLDDKLTMLYGSVVALDYLGKNTTMTEEQKRGLEGILLDKYHNAKVAMDDYAVKFNCARINLPGFDNKTQCDAVTAADRDFDKLDVDLVRYVNSLDKLSGAFKSIYCKYSPGGATPFWVTDPVSAYFGWLNDPVTSNIQGLLLALGQTEAAAGLNTAVAQVASNYTSPADAIRRKTKDFYKTGKKSRAEVGRYVRSYNMTEQWICGSALKQNQSEGYIEGENWPACPHFEYEWQFNDTEAEYQGYVQAFATEYANRINGTDGTMYPVPTTSPKIQVYIGDIYRSAFLIHEKDVYDWHKIKLRRYGLNQKDLSNSSSLPEQEQYYQFGPMGLENMTAAVAGALGVFASFPHFLYGDTRLAAAVSGMEPDARVHDTFLDVEPNTGLLCRAAKRLQLNYFLSNTEFTGVAPGSVATWEDLCANLEILGFEWAAAKGQVCDRYSKPYHECMATNQSWTFYSEFGPDGGVYMPYAWANENLEGDRDSADGLKNSLFFIFDLADGIQMWCLVCSGFTFVALMVVLWKPSDKRRASQSAIGGGVGGGAITDPLVDDADDWYSHGDEISTQ